jgi:hypothetical protein
MTISAACQIDAKYKMNDDSKEPDSSDNPIDRCGADEDSHPTPVHSAADDLTLVDPAADATADNPARSLPGDGEAIEISADVLPFGDDDPTGDPYTGDESPVVAQLVDEAESSVRTGSPFASEPLVADVPHRVEEVIDGPLRYTASGAVAAAAMVLAFAAAAAWWFPAGGTMIAALGCVLSIFGLYSTQRIAAIGILSLHLGLFVLCYGRSIGS